MRERPLKILVADDNQETYLGIRELLADASANIWANHDRQCWEVTWLPRNRDALECLLEKSYEVCFVGCDRGTANGLEWLWEAQSLGNQTPVIFLAEPEDQELNVAMIQAGATDYLLKSHLTASLLECAIRYAIRESQALAALRASEERYALTARGANDGLWDWDLLNNEVHFSPRWKIMLGYQEQDIGTSPEEWFSRVHPDDYITLERTLAAHLDGQSPHFEHEHRMLHQDGTYFWMLSRGIAVRDETGKGRRMVGSLTDIRQRRLAEEKLQHDALHDDLTGLPNRAAFMERLRRSLERARFDDEYVFAVLFLDLDRFKIINDSLGHRVGDQMLLEIARRLGTTLRPSDMVARLGGDEFVVLIDHLREERDVAYVAERVQKILSVPIPLDEREVFTTVSIGITLSSSQSECAEDLLREADTAMHRAKLNGKARFEIFDPQMREQAMRLMQLESDLRRALSRNEFVLYYQPIFSFETGRLAGFESLIRWNHPEKGFIGPGEFIPIAEDNGMINPIGRWVLQESCRQMRDWQKKFSGKLPLTISVNLSGKQFSQPNLIEIIAGILKDTELPAPFLKLEITETVIMENADSAADMLNELKALGSQLAIDDFGTGYSSFSHLHRFPIDTLKIDRAFVSRMDVSLESSEIVRTILTLAHNLKMSVVAEGVETASQIKQLRSLGCDYGQGYYFHRPMAAADAEALIAEDMQTLLGASKTA
ncbi:MAG TPA: EAL domain-containing protein [Blastocatellia bacterium]|nr:EAL domain-containing protein [Blastocatellia bacterium]